MNKVITINSNRLEKSIMVKDILRKKLTKEGYIVSDTIKANTELVIAIGGDGCFLQTIHKFNFVDIPVLGVNTGHLGFLAELSPEQIDFFIKAYKNNEYFIQSVSPIEAKINTKYKNIEITAINEIVIKNVKSRTVHLHLKVDGIKMQSFSGDGMLISTPIGSTAYNYSAGGSIIDPSLDTLQLTPLAPMNTIAYRSFTSSIVLSAKSTINIVPEYRFENSILVVVDGNEYRFNDITDINIERSDIKLKLLRRSDFEFWKRASEKFLYEK